MKKRLEISAAKKNLKLALLALDEIHDDTAPVRIEGMVDVARDALGRAQAALGRIECSDLSERLSCLGVDLVPS
jgi:hypothetical protein